MNNLFGEHTFFLDGGGLKVLGGLSKCRKWQREPAK